MNHKQPVRVIASAKRGKATPEQQRFNRLIERIERARKRLHEWQTATPPFRKSHTETIAPLLAQLRLRQREWLFAADRAASRQQLRGNDAKTLDSEILDAATALLEATPDDAELLRLFERRAGQDYESYQRDDTAATKSMFEDVTGVALGDAQFDNEADVFEHIQATLDRLDDEATSEQMARAARSQQRRARDAASDEQARESARNLRRKAELERVGQSVRTIYRKLVSELHPDRESDETRRLAKTRMMQKVNEAYERNDLLTLLEAQIQLEQLDAAALTALDRPTLKRYNSALSEHLQSLEDELEHAETSFCMDFDIVPDRRPDPKRLGVLIDQERRELRAAIAEIARMTQWLGDPASTRAWLQQVRKSDRERAAFDGDLHNDDPFGS